MTKKRKDPLTTEPLRVLGDVGNHGIAGEGSSPTQKKARRTSQDKPIDETLLFDDDDDDENYTEHENEGSELDTVMQHFLPPPKPEGKTEEEENTKHSPRHFTPQKYSSELEAELTKLREERNMKMLPDDFDSRLAEYKVNLGLDGHMPDAAIDGVLVDEGSTHNDVLFVMQEIILLGVCHGLYTPTEFEANGNFLRLLIGGVLVALLGPNWENSIHLGKVISAKHLHFFGMRYPTRDDEGKGEDAYSCWNENNGCVVLHQKIVPMWLKNEPKKRDGTYDGSKSTFVAPPSGGFECMHLLSRAGGRHRPLV